MKKITFGAVVAITACGQIPRDPAGTFERVSHDHRIRVGLSSDIAEGRPPVRNLLELLSARTSAKPLIERGSLEPMLSRLERGELDIVIAHFARDTPWIDKVALAAPLAVAGTGKARIDLRPAMRNGENRWIMMVEGGVRSVVSPMTEQ